PEVFLCPESANDGLKVVARYPAKLVPGEGIDVYAINTLRQRPAPPCVLGRKLRDVSMYDGWSIGAKFLKILPRERSRRADDIAPKTDARRFFGGEQMSTDHILDIPAPVQ